ncbi:hypothetical protein HDZ31DRAFT_41184 [Schizophyllum fasciatum]
MLACLRRAGLSALRHRPLTRLAAPSAVARHARLYYAQPDPLASLKERFARELGLVPEPEYDGVPPTKKFPGMTRKQLEEYWRHKVQSLPDPGPDENYTWDDLARLDLLEEDMEALRNMPEDIPPEHLDDFLRQAIEGALTRDVEELFGSVEPLQQLREEADKLPAEVQEELYGWVSKEVQKKLEGMDPETLAELQAAGERERQWGEITETASKDPAIQVALDEFWAVAREVTGVKDEDTVEGRFNPTSEQTMRLLSNPRVDEAMNRVMNAFKDQGVDLPSNMVMSQAMREAVEEVRQEEEEEEEEEEDDERPEDAPSSTDNPSQVQPGGKVPSP